MANGKYQKRRYYRRKAQGLCVWCGVPVEDFVCCQACRDLDKQRKRRTTPPNDLGVQVARDPKPGYDMTGPYERLKKLWGNHA